MKTAGSRGYTTSMKITIEPFSAIKKSGQDDKGKEEQGEDGLKEDGLKEDGLKQNELQETNVYRVSIEVEKPEDLEAVKHLIELFPGKPLVMKGDIVEGPFNYKFQSTRHTYQHRDLEAICKCLRLPAFAIRNVLQVQGKFCMTQSCLN